MSCTINRLSIESRPFSLPETRSSSTGPTQAASPAADGHARAGLQPQTFNSSPTDTGEGDRVLPTVRRATAASTEKKSDGEPESRKRGAPLVGSRGLSTSLQVVGWRHRSQERAVVQWSTRAIVATTNHDKPHSPGRRRALARASPRDGLSFAASLPILPSTFLVNLHGTSVSRTAS